MRAFPRLPLAALIALAFFLPPGPAGALPPGFSVELVHTGLNFPTALRFAPDGRLFYTELSTGQIRVFENAFAPTSTLWATVPVAGGGERGLLGLALHPDMPDSPYVYVFHTNPNPWVNRVVRLEDQGGAGTNYTVLFDNLPAASSIHHGGRIGFGGDGLLYVTFGDQNVPSAAQSEADVRGKIHRITRGGQPAPGNPFGATNPAYLKGVRNPFGLCFDPVTGTGYFTENGPSCDDEVNGIVLGSNYGWGPNDFCGGQPVGTQAAIVSFTPTIAPTGCCVYRGSAYPPHLDGNLFFTEYNDWTLRRVKFKDGLPMTADTVEVFATATDPMIDVTMGSEGYLWFCTDVSIGRIVYPSTAGVSPGALGPALSLVPNPFRDRVLLHASGAEGVVRVEVADIQGRRVRRWTSSLPLVIAWDGRDEAGVTVPAGVYVVWASGRWFDVTERLVRIGR